MTVGMFRCFRAENAGARGVELQALVNSTYTWGSGEQTAECHVPHPEGVPGNECGCGLWGFKTLPEAIHQEGDTPGQVFALTMHYGEAIEHETGLRSRFAQIVAFIRPTRPSHLAKFPAEGLRANFPGVPIIGCAEIKDVIEVRGLTMLPRAEPPPPLQWLLPGGELRWAPAALGAPEDGALLLPVASWHPDKVISVEVAAPSWELRDSEDPEEPEVAMVPGPTTYRLKKATFQDDAGQVYAFWQRCSENPASRSEGFREAYQLLRGGGDKMGIHLLGNKP